MPSWVLQCLHALHGGTCASSPQLCIHSLHSSLFLDCFKRGSAAVWLIVILDISTAFEISLLLP